MEMYPSGQFGLIDYLDLQIGNGSLWTQARTQSDDQELLITLHTGQCGCLIECKSLFSTQSAIHALMRG